MELATQPQSNNQFFLKWQLMMWAGYALMIIAIIVMPHHRALSGPYGWYDVLFVTGLAIGLFGMKAMNDAQSVVVKSHATVQDVLQKHYGGIYKRIDQNRELLELLQERAPEFLKDHSWVEGWIQSEDGFLNDLATSLEPGVRLPRFNVNNTGNGLRPYPRSWPGKAE